MATPQGSSYSPHSYEEAIESICQRMAHNGGPVETLRSNIERAEQGHRYARAMLMELALIDHRSGLLELLVDHFQDPNQPNIEGITPLAHITKGAVEKIATIKSSTESATDTSHLLAAEVGALSMLLAHGADIPADGVTPRGLVRIAQYCGNEAFTMQLLERVPTLIAQMGAKAKHAASYSKHF